MIVLLIPIVTYSKVLGSLWLFVIIKYPETHAEGRYDSLYVIMRAFTRVFTVTFFWVSYYSNRWTELVHLWCPGLY